MGWLSPTRRHWRVVFVVGLVSVLALALMPFKIEDKGGFAHTDKLAHMAAFAALAFAAWQAWSGRAVAIVAGLTAYGGAIELLQMLTPSRSASWLDLAADIVGIGFGLLLARARVRARVP